MAWQSQNIVIAWRSQNITSRPFLFIENGAQSGILDVVRGWDQNTSLMQKKEVYALRCICRYRHVPVLFVVRHGPGTRAPKSKHGVVAADRGGK